MLGARNACRTGQVSSEIGFESGVCVDRTKMKREGFPNRGASMNFQIYLEDIMRAMNMGYVEQQSPCKR